ncbi:AP2 domain-containing protein [Streptococcus iniae]|nr:AP2 domain-containing protein [Streptococcus iniae]
MTAKNDLTGRRFERLTVLGDVGKRTANGKVLWHCLCECGKITFVRGDHLKSGKVKSCGCLNDGLKRKRYKDLTGYENDNFKVIIRKESENQRVDWLCECKHCGNYTYLNSNEIETTKSCGCLQGASKEFMDSIRDVESLKSTKPTAKSTTGVRGVYYNKRKGKYQAFINVDKKTVYLGQFAKLSDAEHARKNAEREFWNK